MSPVKKKFKSQPTAGKVMLTLFWDSQRPVLGHYHEWTMMINSAHYSEMVHDNVCTHTAAHIAPYSNSCTLRSTIQPWFVSTP